MWRRIEGTKIHDSKKSKKMLAMAPPDPRCTIVINIEANTLIVASMDGFLSRYIVNKKTRILVRTFLEVEIRPKATT